MVTLDEAGRGALGARVYTVRGPSGPWVEHATVVDFRELRRTNWKVLPDVAPHLLVHLEHDGEGLRAGRVALVGARTRAIETDVSARAWSVGVRLRPGSLAALSGLPADELTDRAVDAAEVWRGPAASLDGEVAEAAVAGPEAVRAVLLRFVDGRARRAAEVSWVARALRSEPAGRCTAVGDLARALGIAPRPPRARPGPGSRARAPAACRRRP